MQLLAPPLLSPDSVAITPVYGLLQKQDIQFFVQTKALDTYRKELSINQQRQKHLTINQNDYL